MEPVAFSHFKSLVFVWLTMLTYSVVKLFVLQTKMCHSSCWLWDLSFLLFFPLDVCMLVPRCLFSLHAPWGHGLLIPDSGVAVAHLHISALRCGFSFLFAKLCQLVKSQVCFHRFFFLCLPMKLNVHLASWFKLPKPVHGELAQGASTWYYMYF